MPKLKKETINDLQEILDFVSEIYSIYGDLIEMELEQDKDKKEFTNGINRIKEIINIISVVYERIAADETELINSLKLLNSKVGLKFEEHSVDNLITYGASKEQMVITRMINDLNKYYSRNIKAEDLYETDDIGTNGETYEELVRQTEFRRHYGMLINNELDKMVLALCASDKIFEHALLGKSFTQIKYEIAFLNTEIETEFLDNKYTVDPKPYIVRSGVNKLVGVNDDYSELYKDELFDSIIAGHLEYFAKDDTEISEDIFNAAECLTEAYYMRSVLLLYDNDEKAYEIMEKVKSTADRLDQYRSFTIVKNILQDMVTHYEDDKTIFQFVSFGGR